MEREEFCTRVLKKVRHATGEEKAAIRAELEGHLEDHAAALGSAGYGEAEAMERALAAMGDPEEIGAGLDRDYPLGWLALSRVSLVITALVCATFLFSWPLLGSVLNSLQARIAPQTSGFASNAAYAYEREVDIRAAVGDDILRIYKVGLDVKADGETGSVGLFACNYDQNPFGYAATGLQLNFETSATEPDDFHGWSGGGNAGAYYRVASKIPVTRADTVVAVTYEQYGKTVRLEVPVPWEDVT